MIFIQGGGGNPWHSYTIKVLALGHLSLGYRYLQTTGYLLLVLLDELLQALELFLVHDRARRNLLLEALLRVRLIEQLHRGLPEFSNLDLYGGGEGSAIQKARG